MVLDIKNVKGRIILKEKDFNKMVERNVTKNNDTSGKITVPVSLINKKVYVVWFEEENKK